MAPIAKLVDPEFATQRVVLSAETARPTGIEPIGIVLITESVFVSITITLFASGSVA
jgi:hypothetical protein